jgi:ABC-type multidrug transport system fused ATPase/permease subunit
LNYLNVIKWVIEQPKKNLLGLLFFSVSYLIFISYNKQPISIFQHILWILIFLSTSLLFSYLLSYLAQKSVKLIKQYIQDKILLKSEGLISTLKSIKELEIFYQEASEELGTPIPFSPVAISKHSNFSLDKIKYHCDVLDEKGYIYIDIDGKIAGLSPLGRKFIIKHEI